MRRKLALAALVYLGLVVVLSPASGLLDLLGKHGLDLDALVAENAEHLREAAKAAGIILDNELSPQ